MVFYIVTEDGILTGGAKINMTKVFNITGLCRPDIHYMVNLNQRLAETKQLVDNGEYFVINRARQFGKTTTLKALSQFLREKYIVISLSFQRMSSANFRNEYAFSAAFTNAFLRDVENMQKEISGLNAQRLLQLKSAAADEKNFNLTTMFDHLSDICASAAKPVVLMIDEIDNASNNQVFLDFLGLLRDCYLNRYDTPAFQSVILAGVYDIKNLMQRIRSDADHRYNSPWNIASDFNVDMSFSVEDIAGMLSDYEHDHHTGMDIMGISKALHDFTSGYPFLVSKMCKIMDEQLPHVQGAPKCDPWTPSGVSEAVKILLKESNTLFDDMIKKLEDYPELKKMLRDILFNGKSYPFNLYNHAINIGKMFGFLVEKNGTVSVSNRIFETHLYNLFLSEEITESLSYQLPSLDKNQFISDGMLNMDLVMKKFMIHYTDIYGNSPQKFVEENGRRLFLLYIKPIINGTGNYYIEAETRDQTRTDIIIDYLGKQFVIELKIWHGEEYHKRGEHQLIDYLNHYHLKKGYLLSFCFNKNKKAGAKEIVLDDKCILEIIV